MASRRAARAGSLPRTWEPERDELRGAAPARDSDDDKVVDYIGSRHPFERLRKLNANTKLTTVTGVGHAPQLSFNFGGRNGWSYISGGPGTARLSLFPLNQDQPTQRRTNTLNYGGGARWFVREHLAFSLDLRFYAMSPLAATETEPGSPRMTVMVLSIGASFK